MKPNALKQTLADLNFDQMRELIIAYHEWAIIEGLLGMKMGVYPLPNEEDLSLAIRIDPKTLSLIDENVKNGDKQKVLKSGLADILRSIPLMQSEVSGAQLNAYLKIRLSQAVFSVVYSNIGLDEGSLVMDEAFPKDIDSLAQDVLKLVQ